MNMGLPMGRFARWLLGPLHWRTVAIAVLPMIPVCWISRSPGLYYGPGPVILSGIVFSVVAGPLVLIIVARKLTAEQLKQRAPSLDRRSQRIIRWTLVVALASAIAVPLRIPLYLSFAISESEMDCFIRVYIDNRGSLPRGLHRVGLHTFDLTRVDHYPDGSYYFRGVDGADGGFAYTTGEFRAYWAVDGYGRLSSHWFWFCEE